MNRRLAPLPGLWLAVALAGTTGFADDAPAGDWRPLFDGATLSGWRAYHHEGPAAGWVVADGALHFPGGEGDDLVTVEEFGDFELELEWKVAAGGNSGIFYRAALGQAAIYMSAPEYQVLDDAAHADGANPLTSAGANYGLDPAPRGVVKPAGEWNQVRIVVRNHQVEHWLNGQKIVAYSLGSDEWQAKVAASKFAAWPAYGQAARGHIGLQDHGDPVWFRNIRIRVAD